MYWLEKNEYAVIYIFIALLLAFAIFQIRDRVDKVAGMMKVLFVAALVTVLGYSVSLYSNSVAVVSHVNAGVFVCEAWLLTFFYQVSKAYVSDDKEKPLHKPFLIYALLILDTVLILGGVHSGFSLSFEPVWVGDSLYVKLIPGVGFVMHLILCYGIVGYTCFILMRKAMRVSGPYVLSYVGIALGLITLVVLNAFFLFYDWLVDLSIALYALMALVLNQYMYQYINHVVRREIKNYVVDNMDMPLLFFDLNNRLQAYNEQAESFFGATRDMDVREFIRIHGFGDVITDENQQKADLSFSKVVKEKDRIFLMQGKALSDKRERFVGTLFLFHDITIEERLKEEANYNATHDKLTGLWNREFFFEMCRQVLKANPDRRFLMLATDIENFKMFNAILGRKVGDDLLVSIAKMCGTRDGKDRVFGRVNADRFAVLIPKDEFNEDRYLNLQKEVFAGEGFSLNIKNHTGICEVQGVETDPELIYDWAYLALTTIKGNIKENFAYFDEGMRLFQVNAALTSDEIMDAIKKKQFMMYLQPQIDCFTGAVVGAEALARWRNNDGEMISPDMFISVLEENGLITHLDYFIWEQACRKLKQWQMEGKGDRSISINISSKDFYMTDLYESITGLVRKYGVDPKMLKLEITETAIVLDVEEQMALVRKFQNFGFRVEMDDFGSGYSSLNSLKNISVDILKLDMKFMGECENVERSNHIVKSMIDLAHSLDMPVIAEGVETKEQLDFLKSIGCHVIQGYYYSRPLPIEEFEEFMKDKKCADIDDFITR